MASDLEQFLREEELFGERIEAEKLARYKQLGFGRGAKICVSCVVSFFSFLHVFFTCHLKVSCRELDI